MQMAQVAAGSSGDVVELTKSITATLSFGGWLLLSRVETELRAHLRREPTRGEVIELLLRHAAQAAGLDASGEPRAAAIAEAVIATAGVEL